MHIVIVFHRHAVNKFFKKKLSLYALPSWSLSVIFITRVNFSDIKITESGFFAAPPRPGAKIREETEREKLL